MSNKQKRFFLAAILAIAAHILIVSLAFCWQLHPETINMDNIIEIEFDDNSPVSAPASLVTASSPTQVSNQAQAVQEEFVPQETLGAQDNSAVQLAVVGKISPEKGTSSGQADKGDNGARSGGTRGLPVTMPYVLERIEPNYPKQARDRGQQGTVYVRILINDNGHVERAMLTRSSGSDALDGAAVQAVLQWLFSPAKDEQGQRVSCYINLPIKFDLQSR